ncbi:MAG: hypothetical protein JWO41_99 [Candidatus Saccharibacteria bacterium]|nr:hypothetical protein [Candidatus Saccharibacteria bacterium]
MPRSQSAENQSFIKRNRLPLSVAVTAGAAVLAAAGYIENGGSKPAAKANVIMQPQASVTPEAMAAPTETETVEPVTPTALPTHRATKAPTVKATHAEVKPSPTKTSESIAQIMDHLRNRKVGDKIPTLNLGEGKLLVYGGKIFTEPSAAAEQTNYLQGTRMQDVEVVTINDKAWACGGVSNPDDIRCVPLNDNPDLSVYDSATDTTTKFTASSEQLAITYLTVAKVGEDGFGYAATANGLEGIAYNPPQA